MSVKNTIASNNCLLTVRDYYQTDLSGRMQLIEDLDFLLSAVSLSQMISLHASFRMYDFDYFPVRLFVSVQHVAGEGDLTKL